MASAPESGRMTRWVGVGVALGLGAAGGLWLIDPANLPIRQIALHGALRHLEPVALRGILVDALDGNMLTQDLPALERRLEREAWVREARIQRRWPAALRIELVEQVPVARWAAGGLLNDQGERFLRDGGADLPLLELAGEPGREAALLAAARRIRTMLEPSGLRLARLEESRSRSLRLATSSGLRVALGRVRPLGRLARWLRYYESYARVRRARDEIIDLRYPNGFAVRTIAES